MNDSAIFGMLGVFVGGVLIGFGLGLVLLGRHFRVWFGLIDELRAAHSRLSDAHNTQSARIERAMECDTVDEMRAVLNGERA